MNANFLGFVENNGFLKRIFMTGGLPRVDSTFFFALFCVRLSWISSPFQFYGFFFLSSPARFISVVSIVGNRGCSLKENR